MCIRDSHPDRLGLPRHALGALQGLGDAVRPGALVQLGQLGSEGGEPRGQVVRRQPRTADGVQRVRRGQQALPGPLHRGGETGQLGLGLAEQRPEPGREPVQVLLDPAQLVLGLGERGARLRGGRGLQVVTVEVVRVDGVDVLVAGLVDAGADRLEVGDRAPGRGGVVDGRDGLDRDPQIALGRVELVERGRGSVLRGLRLGPLALRPPAEPAPGPAAAAREGRGQRERDDERQCDQGEGVPQRVTHRMVCAWHQRRVRLRRCRRHIPLPCCGPSCPVSFSHRLRTNTRAGQFTVRTVTLPSPVRADTTWELDALRGTETSSAPSPVLVVTR